MDATNTSRLPAAAEISEAPPTSAAEIKPSESKFKSETMRKTKPGLKRLALTFTVLFSFLLGLPFLLKSVEIYRSPLPFREIDNLSTAVEWNPLHFPCKFRTVFVGDGRHSFTANELSVLIESHMRKLAAKDSTCCGACGYNASVSVVIESSSDCFHSDSDFNWKCGALSELHKYKDWGKVDDEVLDDYLHSLLEGNGRLSNAGKVYTIIVMWREEQEVLNAVVGKYRHGWIVGRISDEESVKKAAEVFVKAFMNVGKEEGPISGEFMPVGADGKIVLSFNLLNANPHDWTYDCYVFTTNDLPFFVNSNEWHLDTSIAAGGRSKILHFVVYVPSATECPILLQLPLGKISMSNGFISPMWGSIVVWNPSACLNDSIMETHVRNQISSEEMQKIFEVFVGQLRQLFGLKSKGLFRDASGTLRLLTSERGFAEWELDVLSRQHTCFNLLQCTTTLGSLSRLSLPRMIIKEEIREQVRYSLQAAKLALSNVPKGVYDASAVSSRQARSFAEDAFYHSSMMSVSYYSFEHCFAVYSPFFLPASLHVLLTALKEWKRYKQENRKYIAWKAKRDLV